MHKSRLAGICIDCQTSDLETAARFWGAALGFAVRAPSANPADANYRALETAPGGLSIDVQRVEHPSWVHLDIEADDVDAEVARLMKLGAKKVGMVRDWWVMQSPTGQRFCVVPHRQRAGFAEHANSWNDA